jgi:mRNA interferase MazF
VRRGDIYLCDLGQPVGHEQGFDRPVLLISVDQFHRSGLAVVAPLTRTKRPLPTVIEIEGAGLEATSYVQVDQIRTVSQKRMAPRPLGACDPITMMRVERALIRLLGLGRAV